MVVSRWWLNLWSYNCKALLGRSVVLCSLSLDLLIHFPNDGELEAMFLSSSVSLNKFPAFRFATKWQENSVKKPDPVEHACTTVAVCLQTRWTGLWGTLSTGAPWHKGPRWPSPRPGLPLRYDPTLRCWLQWRVPFQYYIATTWKKWLTGGKNWKCDLVWIS